jgi:hypothetical protein
MMNRLRHVLLLAIGVIGLSPAIAGTAGNITGFIKDRTRKPIPRAKITLVDNARGTSAIATTDRTGCYVFPSVSPGRYTLHAEANGFASQNRLSVEMRLDHSLRVDFTLNAETK